MLYNTQIGSLGFFVSPDTVAHKARISGTVISETNSVKVVNLLNRDTMTLVGTAIVNPDGTWTINTEFTTDGKLVVMCMEEGETYNATIYDKVSLCSIDFDYNYLSKSFFPNRTAFQKVIPMTFDGNPWAANFSNEDVRGPVTQYYFDTRGKSGRLLDATDTVVDLSTTKIGVGALFPAAHRIGRINTIEGNGTTTDSVTTKHIIPKHDHTFQILGDSSCILFAPLTFDFSGYGYNVEDLIVYKITAKDGRDLYSFAYGETGQTRGSIVFTQTVIPSGPLSFSFNFWPYDNVNTYLVCQKYGFEVRFESGYLYINVTNNAGATYNVSTSYSYSGTDTWKHIVVAMDSTSVVMYLNGAVRTTVAGNYNHNPKTTPFQSDARFSILGSSGFGLETGGNSGTSGKMNMVRVFNKKVSDAEVTTLYNDAINVSSAGKHELSYITNIMSAPGSICVPTESVGTNTVVIESNNVKNPLTNLYSIDIAAHKNLNVVNTDYFPRLERALMLSGFGSTVGTPSNAFAGQGTYGSTTGGWVPAVTKLYREADMQYYWFQVNLQKSSVMRGLRFRTYSYSTYNDIPTRLSVYTSETGLFRGEEIYRGDTQIYFWTLGENDILPWFKFNFYAKGKYYRFYMQVRSTKVTTDSGYFGVRAVSFELEDKTNFETIKARSIILDIADQWSSTDEMRLNKFVPTINGKPLSIYDWDFYQTSYNTTYSNFGIRAFCMLDSSRCTERHAWRAATNVRTNQRIIAVAHKEIEFDDINVVNYHETLTNDSLRGAKNVKVSISPDVITDTTYNAAISNSSTLYQGIFRQMYPEGSTDADYVADYDTGVDARVNGYYGAGAKAVGARSIAIDFSENLGNSSYMGVRKIEFWRDGKRLNHVSASATIVASSGNNVTYLRNTFMSTTNHFAAYAAAYTWRTTAGDITNQRISLLYTGNIYFDNIRIWNYSDSSTVGYATDIGAKDVRVFGSLSNTQPPTTYGMQWDGSYEILPKTDLVRRHLNTGRDTRFFSIDLGVAKTDYWSARSVVFDLHSTHNIYDNYIRISQLLFLRNENPLPFKSWTVYSSHSDVNNSAEFAFNSSVSVVNYFGVTDNIGWASSDGAPARIIVVFPYSMDFDAVDIMNGFVYSAANEWKRYSGVNRMTVTITPDVLTSENITYMSTISNGEVIYDGGVEPRTGETALHTALYHQQRIIAKESKYYSRAIEVLIQSNHTNGSTDITDSSYREFALTNVGGVQHSTTQSIIGPSSINTSTGYISINDFRGRVLSWGGGQGAFMMGAWIYPTSVAGDKGLISKWGVSGEYAWMLSINNGYLEFKTSTDLTTVATYTGTIPISTNQWTWVEVRKNHFDLYLFVGGVLDSTFAPGALGIAVSPAQVNIGSFGSDVANCFQGYMQEIIIKTPTMCSNIPSPGPTSFTNISPSEPGFGEVYVSLSFDEFKKTYKIYNTSTWRAIVSCDPLVHGVLGDNDWYFRDSGDVWSKTGVLNRENALSLAVIYTENQMTSSYLSTLTNVQFYLPGGYTTFEPDIAISFSKDSDKVSLGVDGININNVKYWVGAVPLKHAPTTAISSKVDCLITETDYDTRWLESYRNSLSIFNWVEGSGWVACERGGTIPSITSGMTTQGVTLFFKVEMDLSICEVPYAKCSPRLVVEVN